MARDQSSMSEELQSTKEASHEASHESPLGTVTRSRPSPLIETPPPPAKDLNSLVPESSMDAASYAAGERAAYARAFASALPSQQALGQLFQAVDTLHERLEKDATAVRTLQIESIRTSDTMASISHRIESIEGVGLPNLQRRCDDIAARPVLSPEVASALQHLRTTLSELSLSQQRCLETAVGYAGRGGFLIQQLQTLLQTLSTYAGGVLNKADVAAVFLSRKVLIGDVAEVVGGMNRTKSKLKVAAGAALFVGFVEGAWQVQERTARQLPLVLRSANAPLLTGLKALRTVVWTAAFILAAIEVRTACNELFSGQKPSASATAPCSNNNIETCSSTISGACSPQQALFPPSLDGNLADLESGRTPATKPASAGSPAPAKELLRNTDIFEKTKNKSDSDIL